MSSCSAFPYIGSCITLISVVGIRYQGILFNINTNESTVSLQHVRSFGTEGRAAKVGLPECPPRDEVYDIVVFKGKDIQDLTVSEPPPLDDPAIVAVNQLPNFSLGDHHHNHHMGDGSYPMMDQNLLKGSAVGQQGHMDHHYGPNAPQRSMVGGFFGNQMRGYMSQRGGYQGGGNVPPMRRGYNYMRRNNHLQGGGSGMGGGGKSIIAGELPAQPNEAMKSQVQDAFDFETANAKFDKSTVVKGTDGTGAGAGGATEGKDLPEVHVGYNKAQSFFDSISCDTLDRDKGVDSRVDRDKQRQVDAETFGSAAAAAAPVSRYRRGPRRSLPYRRTRGPVGMQGGPAGGGHMGHHGAGAGPGGMFSYVQQMGGGAPHQYDFHQHPAPPVYGRY